MKTNLKDNIWIEGFKNENNLDFYFNHNTAIIIYSGKTDEIPEEIALECLMQSSFPEIGYKAYDCSNVWVENYKESIKSACQEEYCIIYKEI